MGPINDTANRVQRRDFMLGAVGAGTLVAACSPTLPSESPQPSSSQGREAWELEWERLVSEARREGTLSLVTGSGTGFRKGIQAFEEAFPGITVAHDQYPSMSVFAPKAIQERKAGQYSWDVAQVAAATAMSVLHPEGVWDPIRPSIIRPDITDDRFWQGGYEAGFVDKAKKTGFAFVFGLQRAFAVNTDLVKPGEIKTVKDILDPKWRGRIMMSDVRSGITFRAADEIRKNLGEDVLKQLLVDQRPVFSRDSRQIFESLMRGQYAIASEVPKSTRQRFLDEGVGKNVSSLDLPEADFVNSSAVFVLNRAPHPNAAAVFINWLLTKEGQTIWGEINEYNSRRTDVQPADPDSAPRPGQPFLNPETEETVPRINQTIEIITRLVG